MTTFREFEHRGWQEVANRYHDAFASVTLQSIDPLLNAVGAANERSECKPDRAQPQGKAQPSRVRLLDLACGPGYAAGTAAQRGAVVLGIDFSSEMVEVARNRYPGVEFVEGDAEELSLPDAQFDAVVMNYGMLHLSRPERAASESYRVLREGGRFAFTVWDAPERTLAFGIVLEVIRKHGNLNVSLPAGPPFFRFSDVTESKRLLSDAGFLNPQVITVPQVWRFASSDSLFDTMYNGSVRNAALLRAQKPDALAAIQMSMRADVEEYRNGAIFELPMPAVLSWGQKGLPSGS